MVLVVYSNKVIASSVMKFKHTQSLSRFSRKRPKKGFALIATLTLMMLLAMLAVAIMGTAASQNRIALQTMLQAEARQQALVGLDAAIGELQVELGPDQRVSATSGILSDGPDSKAQHLLGVWNSWDGPIYGKSASGLATKISSTYEKGRSNMFRRWMISARNRNETRTLQAAEKLCSRQPGSRICMVGEGTLGKSLSAQHYVYADLLSMPAMGNKNEACFAWWVGGENQKAKISIQNRPDPESEYEALQRTWDTPAPKVVENRDMDFLPDEIEAPARLTTLASLPLLGSSSQSAGMPYFYDVTTTSYTLPINVSMGGFKQDLCLLLNKETLKDTEFAARSNQDCPLVENSDLPQGTEPDMPIGSWQNLHAYYNCWPDGSAKDQNNFTARMLGTLDSPYTRMSGSVIDKNMNYGDNPDSFSGDAGENGSYAYDSRTLFEEGSETSGYARTPVMLAFISNFGLVVEETDRKAMDGKPLYDLSVCFAPMFLWWNPYNVPMRIRGQQLWSYSLPYRAAWIQTLGYPQTRPVKDANDYEWGQRGIRQSELATDFGEYFQKDENNKTADIVFEPGEIIFFSPAKARIMDEPNEQGEYGEYANPWVPGYHPNAVAGFKAKVYTNQNDNGSIGVANTQQIEAGNFRLSMRLGINESGGGTNTDGYLFAPGRREVMTLLNGYNGMGKKNPDSPTAGKRGQSPQRGLLGWYDPEDTSQSTVFCDAENNGAVWTLDGTQQDENHPYYVAAVGIAAKSANPNLDSVIYKGKDFRTKIWQHSSPAFWGSAMAKPDHQMRQYHPYQLAVLPVSAGMDSAPMDNIGRNGVLGINSEGEQVSFASVMELPLHPPFSLAGFAGMRLQPGWYKTENKGEYATHSALRRMQYQAGVPGVGIGNAFADPCLPADDVYTYFENNALVNSDLASNSRVFGDFFDHGLLINDALWDRWFCSSVSDMPKRGGGRIKAEETLSKFLKGQEELPVSRYKRVNTPYDDDKLIARIMSNDGWKHIAQYLMVDGGFNVNSVSVEAWTAVLQGLAKRKLVANVNNKLDYVEKGKNDKQVLFSRFMLSTTNTSVDSLGGYSMIQGSPNFRDSGMTSAWGEVRMLESESIRKLAEKIVEQVRKRGPFLSMSDFVNRRLEAGENGLTGALQAAIDATDINRDFNEIMVAEARGDMFKNSKAGMGSLHTAAPGYLIQSDVLAALGNILTVRDDTFTVRSYGCVRNANKAILAQAWCEAVVQRTMDYVDPTNAPQDSDYKPDGTKGTGVSDTNKVMGRQFRIVSFKWLDNWDI